MNGQEEDSAALSVQQLKVLGLAVLAIGSIIVLVSEIGQLDLMKEQGGIF